MSSRSLMWCSALGAALVGLSATTASAAPAVSSEAVGDDPAQARVVNGTVVRELMGAVSLTSGSHFCSASLYNAEWVLSAKHCNPGSGKKITAKINGLEWATAPDAIEVVKVETKNDVALMKLATPAKGPMIKLAEAAPANGAEVNIYGWGRTAKEGGASPVLKTARMKVTGTSSDAYNGPAIRADKVDGYAWKGDSGGPMIYQGAVVGVASTASFEMGYANYSSVVAVRSWIEQIAGKSGASPQ